MSRNMYDENFSIATLIDGDNRLENCAVALELPGHISIRFSSYKDALFFEEKFQKRTITKELKIIRDGFDDLLLVDWVGNYYHCVPVSLKANIYFNNILNIKELDKSGDSIFFEQIYIWYKI